ncbi:uncharacterized protein LOC117321564 [Pecten maximus]|uniref:uncharacterized protein LOC117321564 n=1 Tax=Pecten maximus TaxID=6579 RepID=UPI001458B4A7|nr:uncharacterized protein LOC117321564 [Pecten maximus]
MATSTLPTTSVIGYNTTANSTWAEYHGNRTRQSYKRDPNEIQELQARFLPTILVSVPANLILIVIILCNRSLRTQTFFLGVLSLTVFDFCYSAFVLPINMDHFITWGRWRHGDIVCFIYIVLINSKVWMSALMIIVLSVERLLTKLRSVAVIGEKMRTNVSRVLIAIPWCMFLLGSMLITWIKYDEMSRNKYIHETYCLFMVEQTFHIPYMVLAFHIPLSLLVLVPIAMLLVYKYKKSDWNRLSAGAQEPEAVSLYMSTLSVWIASFVYVAFSTPMAAGLTQIVMCIRGWTKCPSMNQYKNSYTVSLLPCVIMPFLWIITVEIRAVLSSIKARVMKKVTSPDGEGNGLSFSSLRHRVSSDGTDIHH